MAKAISISLGMSNERVSVTYCSLAKLFNLINSLLVKINFALKKSMLSIAVLRKSQEAKEIAISTNLLKYDDKIYLALNSRACKYFSVPPNNYLIPKKRYLLNSFNCCCLIELHCWLCCAFSNRIHCWCMFSSQLSRERKAPFETTQVSLLHSLLSLYYFSKASPWLLLLWFQSLLYSVTSLKHRTI